MDTWYGRFLPHDDNYAPDGTFLQQLQWAPASIGPTQMMGLQMMAIQVALKSAIAEVEEAVRRVEGKVEEVLQLAEASRAGDVRRIYLTLRRAVEFVEKHGSLPNADWDSGRGPRTYAQRHCRAVTRPRHPLARFVR